MSNREESYEDIYSGSHKKHLADLKKTGNIEAYASRKALLDELKLYKEDDISHAPKPVQNDGSMNMSAKERMNLEKEKGKLRDGFVGMMTSKQTVTEQDMDDDDDDDYDVEYRGVFSEGESDSEDEDEKEKKKKKKKKKVEKEEEKEEDDEKEEELHNPFDPLDEEGREEEKEAHSFIKKRLERFEGGYEDEFLEGMGLNDEEKNGEDEEEKKKIEEIQKLSENEKMEILEKECPEVIKFVEELKESNEKICELQYLLRKVKKRKQFLSGDGNEYLEVKYQLILIYIMNILFFLSMKSSGEDVRIHPVVSRILELRKLLQKFRSVDEQIKEEFEKLIELMKEADKKKKKKKDTTKTVEKTEKKREKDDDEKEEKNLDMDVFKGFSTMNDLNLKSKKISKKRKREEEKIKRKMKDFEDQEEDQEKSLEPEKKIRKKKKKKSALQKRKEENVLLYGADPDDIFKSNIVKKPSHEIMKSKGLKEKGKKFEHPRAKHRKRYLERTKEWREKEERFESEKGNPHYSGEVKITKNTVRARKIKQK